MFDHIDHIAVEVADIERSLAFYSENFGFKKYFDNIIPTGQRIVYIKLNQSIIELVESNTDTHEGYHFCLHSTSFENDVNELKSKGIPIYQDIHHTNPRIPEESDWKRVVFIGPDKELIEIRG